MVLTQARSRALLVLLCSPMCLASSVAASQDEESSHASEAFAWTEGYSLILTDAKTLDEAYQAVDLIQERGGQVAVVVSPRVLLGWTAPNLRGKAGIRSIHAHAVKVPKGATLDESEAVRFFNEVATGAWRQKKEGFTNHTREVEYGPDALEGPMDGPGFRGNGPGVEGSSSPGNSDVMAGRVSYNVIYVESNGAADPNTYSWTCADLSTIQAEVNASLSFWSSRAANYGVPLTWVTTHYRPAVSGTTSCSGTSLVRQPYEPILRPGPTSPSGDTLWISAIMCNFGHCAGDKFARTNSFNTARRNAVNANWATTQFVAYNPSPAPTGFTDGYFAYAYRSGHYSQLLYRNDGWAVSQYDLVSSHETGHLFGHFDEYASSGCNNCTTGDAASKNVVNGNCANCAVEVPCMMKNNEAALCGYTPGQIGWGLDFNWTKTLRTTSFTVEKTNWVPGQAIRYGISIDVPGQGECVTLVSRWFRQFPGGINEAESFTQPCLITAGGNRLIALDRAVPLGSGIGEAAVEVMVELQYPSGFRYGNGLRASSRGKFYVLNAAARMATQSPEPEYVDPPHVAPDEP